MTTPTPLSSPPASLGRSHLTGPIPFRRLAELITRFGFVAQLQRLAPPDPDAPWQGPSGPPGLVALKALIYSPASPTAADGSLSGLQAQGLVLLPAEGGPPQRGDALILADAKWQIAASVRLTGGTDRLICQLALHQTAYDPNA